MLDFCLILGNTRAENRNHELSRFCAYPPERILNYDLSEDGQISVVAFWRECHPFHNFSDNVRVDENGFALLAGYPLDENLVPIRTVAQFDLKESKNYDGDYFYLSVRNNGQIDIRKSVICSYQLYSQLRDNVDVLASRASLAAVAATGCDKPEPNLNMARWICTYGGGGNSHAMFENTDIVLSNQSISVKGNRLIIGDQDFGFLNDQSLRERYAKSPRKYWDEVFEYLVESTAVLDFSDRDIEFPLSGGKDSRLLLGLIAAGGRQDRLRRVFTNGPAFSPEVRSAQMVCESLGLDHEFIDHTSLSQPMHFSANDKILPHVHITEWEMSPHDLTWGGKRASIIQIHGLESGLRDIAANRDIESREKLLRWFDLHLVGGDKCRLYKSGVGDENMDETRKYVDAALSASIQPSDIPILHRCVLRSGRWVSRTWRAYNDRFFAPYIFANSTLLKATFNSGAKSRAREEFHFEMIRRIKPELIEIPFAGQAWDGSFANENGFKLSTPLEWPEGTRPHTTKNTHLALHEAFEEFRAFFATHQGTVTSRLLDRDKLNSFDIEDTHPSIYLALWNFVQVAALELAPHLDALNSGTSCQEVGLPSFDY